MNILFTGSSSFTGFWFIQELLRAGHQVTAVFQGKKDDYTGVRKQRVEQVMALGPTQFECPFGSEKFFSLLNQAKTWDVLCHHAAEVTDYKSLQFDVIKAFNKNTQGLPLMLPLLKEKGCPRVVLTGSVFEQNEGVGSEPLRAFSPYGLSKTFTSDYFSFFCDHFQMRLGKFVIPNPFGPYEEPRFTAYLMKHWLNKKNAHVDWPAYVRDNIPVSLLAKVYAHFVRHLPETPGFEKASPSGYVASQGEFTSRVATEMRRRTKLPCEFTLSHQTRFPEPAVRTNTQPVNHKKLEWDEKSFWDDFAAYYQKNPA